MSAQEQKVTFAQKVHSAETVGIPQSVRAKHVALFGSSGSGKSSILRAKMVDDIKHNRGFCFIDPHGALAEQMPYFVPEEKAHKVIYLDAADSEHPFGLNLVGATGSAETDFAVEDTTDILQSVWQSDNLVQQIPEGIDVLANVLSALNDVPEGSTFLGVERMLTDPAYRSHVAKTISNDVVRPYFNLEYPNIIKRKPEIGRSIVHRARRLTRPSLIRNIIGQAKTTIDFKKVVNGGYFLIINLSRGKIREYNTRLLGSIFLSELKKATMARESMAESQRHYFSIYTDESHYFSNDSATLSTFLDEARKYNVGLILSYHYFMQLPEKLLAAVLANVGTLIALRVNYDDAAKLAKEFYFDWDASMLVSQNKHELFYKIKDDPYGHPRQALTIPIPEIPKKGPERIELEKRKAQIIENSRKKYTRPRAEVEQKIHEFYKRRYEVPVKSKTKKSDPG